MPKHTTVGCLKTKVSFNNPVQLSRVEKFTLIQYTHIIHCSYSYVTSCFNDVPVAGGLVP